MVKHSVVGSNGEEEDETPVLWLTVDLQIFKVWGVQDGHEGGSTGRADRAGKPGTAASRLK